MTDPRDLYGRIVNDTRRAYDAEQAAAEGRRGFCIPGWDDRPEFQRELDRRIGEAVAAAVLEPFDAALPEGARCSVTPELLTALVALYQTWWNKVGTLEGDTPGHALISYEDVNLLDEAAQAAEALLYPPALVEDEGGDEDGDGRDR